MTPTMTLSWLFGLILIHKIGFQQLGQTWMIFKTNICGYTNDLSFLSWTNFLGQFKLDLNEHSHKFYRFINRNTHIITNFNHICCCF